MIVCGTKHLTTKCSGTKEAFVKLKTRRDQSLEEVMEWIDNDELVEVTPRTFRMRKRELNESARKRAKRAEA